MSRVKMEHISQKQKNSFQDFLYVVLYMANYQKIDKKFKNCWGQVYSFFSLDPKLEMDTAETLVLH